MVFCETWKEKEKKSILLGIERNLWRVNIYWKGEREREEIENERKENREGKDPTAWKKVKNEKY